MLRKFALATIVVGLLTLPLGRIVGPDEFAASPAGSSTTMLPTVQGLKPLPEIIEFWETRAAANPLDYPSRTQLGIALSTSAAEQADLELYAEAERAFRSAINLNPNSDEARLGLASALVARHDFDDALAEVEAVKLRRSSTDRPPSAPALAIEGDAAIGIGRYDRAADAYEQLVTIERSSPTVSRLARLRSVQGDPAGAVELAQEALALSEELAIRPSDRAFYHFQLGHFRFARGQVDPAIESYRNALALAPEHPGASEGLAFALAAAGRHDEAASAYEVLLDRSPAADVHGLYADVLRLQGRHLEAADQERLAERLAAEGLDGPAAERRHLAGYYQTRNPDLAIELARADLAERRDVGAYDTLAWALHRAGRHREAGQVIAGALAFGTEDAALHYHAAAIATELGDRATASAHLERALAINPRFHPTEADEAAALAERLRG